MSRFLTIVPVADAVATVVTISPQPVTETVPVECAAGRILAAVVTADSDIPGFDRSVVDGYAVRAADTAGAGESVPALLQCTGRVAMGRLDTGAAIGPGTCSYIPTGGVLPAGADAVVMVEYSEEAADTVLVKKSVSHGRMSSSGTRISGKGRSFFPRAGGSRRRMPACWLRADVPPSPLQKSRWSGSSRPATNWCR